MADLKISELTAATTPLTGAEVVPVLQGGANRRTTVTALRAGLVEDDAAALTDAREWSASTISQEEAEAGTATTRRAFTAQRVFQAVAAWWAASSAKTKLDGIESGAEVNVNADWNASSGDAEILNKPTLGSAAAAATTDFATAAQGSLADSAVQPGDLATVATSGAYSDLSGTPGVVSSSTAGLQPASGYGTISYAAQVTLDFAALAGQMNSISLTGDLELLTSNLANAREVRLRLVCDATERTLTFPTDWRFVGTKPANLAASKVAVLSLAAFGATNADVVAAYAVQS